MIIVLSPSKTLDYTSKTSTQSHSTPDFIKESKELIKVLRKKKPTELSQLMGISDKLAQLNYERYKDFSTTFSLKNARQAILAFKGDVYESINVDKYKENDFVFAQSHLRILSGLYGLLRPLDLIQPYRLEMGTRLANPKGADLYEFWGDKITNTLNDCLKKSSSPLLVNLASQEYFAAVNQKKLKGELLNVAFKEKKGGDYQVIGLFAKKARGAMADYIIKNRIEKSGDLMDFSENGYKFNKKLSDSVSYVFTRNKP